MKTFIASIAIVSIAGIGVFAAAGAATEGTVNATVTAEVITIAVADGVVAYGILPTNATEDTTASGTDDSTQTVTNNSNVAVNLATRSSDAVGGTNWNLAATNASLNAFTHESSPDGTNWTAFNPDNSTYTTLKTNVAAAATQNLDLRIGTPTSVSDNVLKTITVTVLATATAIP